MTGRFVTIEGGEGAGKSTQLRRLVARLRQHGVGVVATREPGGSPGAEEIRKLFVGGEPGRWDALTEALLVNAARRDHLERTVRPALAQGLWVVSDRFADSTFAYQGYAGGVALESLRALHAMVAGDLRPDLTLVLDLPVDAGLARAAARGGDDRFERKERAFHEKLRSGFLDMVSREPDRCAVIDGGLSPDAIENLVWVEVERRLLAPR